MRGASVLLALAILFAVRVAQEGNEFLIEMQARKEARKQLIDIFAAQVRFMLVAASFAVGAVVILIPFLGVGGEHAAADVACEETARGIEMLFGFRMMASMEDVLRALILRGGDERGVVALIRDTVAVHDAPIECIAEPVMDGFAVDFLARLGTQTLCVQDVRNLQERILTRTVEFKGASHIGRLCSLDMNLLVAIDVPKRRAVRPVAFLQLGTIAALYVLAQIAYVLVCHAKLHRHHQHVITRQMHGVVCAYLFDAGALQLVDNASAIGKITRQTVEFPAEYRVGFVVAQHAHHFAEDGASLGFGRAAFAQRGDDMQPVALRNLLQFRFLRIERKDLPVFGIGGLADIGDVA